jgi:hypothetical protein
MTTYRVKTGSDVALETLTVLDPQPDPGTAIEPARRTYGGDGTVYDEGRHIVLPWSALDDASAYQTILALFGLNASTSSAAVTVYVRDEIYAWVRMNGTAVRPVPGKEVKWGDVQSRPLDIKILVKDLSTAA